jgi:hypothetical protein
MATLLLDRQSSMTGGERRLAQRLEQKLPDDCLVWYDVPISGGTLQQQHPDFIILDPRRGILILEVTDFQLSTIQEMNKLEWKIRINSKNDQETTIKSISNPLEQARRYAHQVNQVLEQDPGLRTPRGKLKIVWSYGVVLTNIPRSKFDEYRINETMDPNRVLCQNEMVDSVDPVAFRNRLSSMFPFPMDTTLTQADIDRVRWSIFPEVRMPSRTMMFPVVPKTDAVSEGPATWETPSIVKILDLHQEQLARNIGQGHRVIHGVAGSGKTHLLIYRAEYIAKQQQRRRLDQQGAGKPILVLCYNQLLATHLAHVMTTKGIDGQVVAVTFHKWCRDLLVELGEGLPSPARGDVGKFMADMVTRVVDAVDRGAIPSGQYSAILVDEGHDFEPEWLKLIVRMVGEETNSLLLLYDDAQSIYVGSEKENYFRRRQNVGLL